MPPKPEEIKKDWVVEVGFILLVLIFIYLMWSAILQYILLSRFGTYAALWAAFSAWFMSHVWPILMVIFLLASIAAAVGIVRFYRKLVALNREERKIYGPNKSDFKEEPVVKKNSRWEHAITHLNSANASDWRLAIIEADVMLDELLRAQGYHGDSIGDMLKGVEKSDFTTVDAAWEAHKVRNQIVHSGTDYDLTEREAKRVMSLYESVFKEFQII